MRTRTETINAEAFLKVAAVIAAEPEKYDQRLSFMPPEIKGCGSACCVMGHAAQIAGETNGLEPATIQHAQHAIACRMLGIGLSAGVTLFAVAWPVNWFFESGAAELEDLKFHGNRERRWERNGRLAKAEPLAKEAVAILRWIAKLGSMPAAA